MWHSEDEDGLQSQRFGVQIQVSTKSYVGLGLGIVLGLGASIGSGIEIGLGLVVSMLFFLKNTPPPSPTPRQKN